MRKKEARVKIGQEWRGVYSCPLDDGVVDQCCLGPCNGDRNWVAKVHHDIRAPGGLGRKFLERARGGRGLFDTRAPQVSPGDYLEIGADDVSSRGRRREDRGFVRVLEIDDESILFRAAGRPPKGSLRPIEKEWDMPATFAGRRR